MLISDSTIPLAVSLARFLQSSSKGHEFGFGLLSEPAGDGSSTLSPTSIPWNRSSSLSARTAILDMKNKFSSFDRALLIFDSVTFSENLPDMDSATAIRCIDEYVRGYLLVSSEIIKYFRQQKAGFVIFAVRSQSSPEAKANIPVAVAESAFMRLAEETAASFADGSRPDDTGLQALLVKLDPSEDTSNIEWLSLQVTGAIPARTQVRWVKAGSRGLFGKL